MKKYSAGVDKEYCETFRLNFVTGCNLSTQFHHHDDMISNEQIFWGYNLLQSKTVFIIRDKKIVM